MSWRLYVDIGNSAVKWAVRQPGVWLLHHHMDHLLGGEYTEEPEETLAALGWPATEAEMIVEAIEDSVAGAGLMWKECSGIGVSCTCDAAGELLEALGQLGPCPLKRVGAELRPAIRTAYHRPSEIGADRWANVVAARTMYGAPVIVLDAGTALTCEIVDAAGVFIGGFIGLGLGPMIYALTAISERLVAAAEREQPAEAARIPRSTTEALHRGLVCQLAAAADRFAGEGRKAVGEAPVLLTGGEAELCRQFMQTETEWVPLLTLEGIRLMDHYE